MSFIKKNFGSKLRLKEHSWVAYPTLLVSLLMISYFSFSRSNFFHIDVKSARYLTSALLQSEAAILALVVSLSLIAVQITASSYSPVVTDFFRKTYDPWILIVSYVGVMIYDMLVLKMIKETISESMLEKCTSILFFLGIYCFSALGIYMYRVLNMITPLKMIEELSQKIKKDSFLKTDPTIPIINIVLSSMMRYDQETAGYGIRKIGDGISDMFKKEKLTKQEGVQILYDVCNRLAMVGRLAVSREDEDSARKVIIQIWKMGNIAMEKEWEIAASRAVTSLGEIGKAGVERKFLFVGEVAIRSLGEIGKAAKNGTVVSEVERFLKEIKNVARKDGLLKRTAEEYLEQLEAGD